MRRLTRHEIPAPACLERYDRQHATWNQVCPTDKQTIRDHLEQMQGRRCAYCEGSLDEYGQHIEHFRRRCDSPDLTFAWENLFWSCEQDDSCGKHKDNHAKNFNIADVLDPTRDDPDRFFRFRSDGTIGIRAGLPERDLRRAEVTLQVFNLNPLRGRLRNARKRAISLYLKQMEDAQGWLPEELRVLFMEELAHIEDEPFSTALRHVLTEPT